MTVAISGASYDEALTQTWPTVHKRDEGNKYNLPKDLL